MKRTILGMAEAGESLLQQALQAIRAYHAAHAEGRPTAEVERLRLEADHLYQTVIDYQLHKAGTLGETQH